jgi:hypothetical protein
MVNVLKSITLYSTIEMGLVDVDCELEYKGSLFNLTGYNKDTSSVEFMVNDLTKDHLTNFIEFLQKGLDE